MYFESFLSPLGCYGGARCILHTCIRAQARAWVQACLKHPLYFTLVYCRGVTLGVVIFIFKGLDKTLDWSWRKWTMSESHCKDECITMVHQEQVNCDEGAPRWKHHHGGGLPRSKIVKELASQWKPVMTYHCEGTLLTIRLGFFAIGPVWPMMKLVEHVSLYRPGPLWRKVDWYPPESGHIREWVRVVGAII